MMFGVTLSEFQQVKPYLDIMGGCLLYCGGCGKGQMTKAFNSVVYDINLATISVILPLAMKSGLDPNVLGQLFTTGFSRSFASEQFVPRMIKCTFTGDYSLQGALKDITNV